MKSSLHVLNIIIGVGLSASFLLIFLFHFADSFDLILPKGVEQSSAKELTRAALLAILAIPRSVLLAAILLWLELYRRFLRIEGQ